MGSVSVVDETVKKKSYDVENTIFVAVGKNVSKSQSALFWAVHNFNAKKICLLHVHADSDLEREKMMDVLDQYCLILDQEKVQVDKVWIEMSSVEMGIVEIIDQYDIRWLVMGAAADKYYSSKLAGLKSKKARFVCQHAPISCHIWFACKGCLIYTREGRNVKSEEELSLPLLLMNSDSGIEEPESLGSYTQTHSTFDAEKEDDNLGFFLETFNNQCALHSDISSNTEEEKIEGQATEATEQTCHKLEQAILVAKDSKQMAFEEAVKRWKEEDDAMEAKCKAMALENLCVKEISLRKEMEEKLARGKQDIEKTKNQRDTFVKEFQKVQEQKSVLEDQLAESSGVVKGLEEKILSAVELLISFKKQRDAARTECENARKEVNRQRKLVRMGAVSFCRSEILEFSFVDINEATHDFDPSWKIGEGRYGSVYKGILRHVHVAIKMLPSYGSQSQLDFQNGVEVLSRVRHPHLVTLIGTCPESKSLVYEHVRNGSLEDSLACKNKRHPLPWQIRIHIANEICSALIFLHSNKPCIIHGSLKPSKVLLDDNLVSKLSDFGISLLVPQGERMRNDNPMSNKSNLNFTSLYDDPGYTETGKLTPRSDVYSFGIILLRLLTGKPVPGLVKYVKCALEEENFKTLLDTSSGDWPVEDAKLLARLALRCCEKNPLNRPDLVSEIWNILEPMRASCGDLLSSSRSKELHRIPSHFVCPIFQEVMKDPQIAADGFTYEGDAIRGWLKSGHNTSPMTNLKLEHCNLLPNHALHQAIQESGL
ncbi:U-box domain-containing protein 32-like isoform X2 [Mercurialis annua]|uniref:U-box domain-containing protein 32-like isoform X2 n=1 Tax=Mercurialis annua TaxID=3986 RepID=UPI00215DDFAE|nr:U-box domain-containing protein 32-like isoform X2 [Mercurialis annua]